MIGFGTPVLVHAIAHRLKSRNGKVYTSHYDSIRYGVHVQGPAWEGAPLPDTPIDPEQHRAVMIRRFPVEKPGIVVGSVWREEGYVEGGDPPALIMARRVPLYEVAINGERLGKTRLVLVWEKDLEEL